MRLKLLSNGQFHLIYNFPHLLPPKHLIFGEISKIFISMEGGTSANFLEFSNFFKLFHTNVAGNDPQWQIWPKKWLRLGSKWPFLHICLSFPPKWGWDWLGMVNFTWFTTFPIFCHQSISFLEKSQKFSFLRGGVHRQIFGVFQLFQIVSHQCGCRWPTMANLAKKVA